MAKKLVHIPHYGPIHGKAGITGPLTTPYMEEVATIATILIKGARVVEVLADGSEVELTLSNYDKDNTPAKKEEAPVKEAAPAPQQQQKNQQQQGNKNQQQNPPKQNTEKTEVAADDLTAK